MSIFLVIALLVWFCVIAAWFVGSKYLKSADAQRFKARLMGSTAGKSKKASTGDGKASTLLQKQETQKTQIAARLLDKYNLTEKT